MVLTGEQIRAARAMIRMEQAALAEKAGVSVETVKRLEGFDGEPKAQYGTLLAIRKALELCGLDFDGDGVKRATDRNVRVIDALAAEVGSFVSGALTVQTKRDSKFFDRGSAHVADALVRSLSPVLVKKLVEHVLPREKPPKRPRKPGE